MNKRKSVILLSGGLDSTANLAFCALHDHPVLALTFDYGQRAFEREKAAAEKFATHFDVRHQVVELPWLKGLGSSSLTHTETAVPQLDANQLDTMDVIEKTAQAVWVPNRNGALINIAAAFAESEGAEQVVVGFNSEEATTFPDNSAEFLDRSSAALRFSTANGVRVQCYTLQWDKTKIVRQLEEHCPEFPFDWVWSCYKGDERPCGVCESCQRFQRARDHGTHG